MRQGNVVLESTLKMAGFDDQEAEAIYRSSLDVMNAEKRITGALDPILGASPQQLARDDALRQSFPGHQGEIKERATMIAPEVLHRVPTHISMEVPAASRKTLMQGWTKLADFAEKTGAPETLVADIRRFKELAQIKMDERPPRPQRQAFTPRLVQG